MTDTVVVANGTRRTSREPIVLLAIGASLLAWSGVRPADRTTWVLEVFPILIGVPILIATARRFPLTPLLYRLILLHAAILMLGGHYTYAKVPLGFWMEELFGFTRNHYDRIGHFMQGFVPAMLAREVLLRKSPLRRGKWLFFLVICVCALVTVSYEFIEWWSALIGGASADAFLGTQGDPWDTQWDMCLAITGAIAAQVTLPRVHDRALTMLLDGPARAVVGNCTSWR
jgi:putative membrane protein